MTRIDENNSQIGQYYQQVTDGGGTPGGDQELFEEFSRTLEKIAGQLAKERAPRGEEALFAGIEAAQALQRHAVPVEEPKKEAPQEGEEGDSPVVSHEEKEAITPENKAPQVEAQSDAPESAPEYSGKQQVVKNASQEPSVPVAAQKTDKGVEIPAGMEKSSPVEAQTVTAETAPQSADGEVEVSSEEIVASAQTASPAVSQRESAQEVKSRSHAKERDAHIKELTPTNEGSQAAQPVNSDVSAAPEGEKTLSEQIAEVVMAKAAAAQALPPSTPPAAPPSQVKDSLIGALLLKPLFEASGAKSSELKSSLAAVGSMAANAPAAAPQVNTVDASLFKNSNSGFRGDSTGSARQLPRAQQERALEKVEQALKEVAKSKDGTTISLKLDPPTLGQVKIDATLKDNQLHVRLLPESAAVAQVIREKLPELTNALQRMGLDVEKLTISLGNETFSSSSGEQFLKQGESFEKMQGRAASHWLGGESVKGQPAAGISTASHDHWVA